ncbi:efflux RND transporter permease subunit [candidate division FCPU426 bacterium]|nr:efflux RND transporter permease subunit [candidate division FCPU426 bacterium]
MGLAAFSIKKPVTILMIFIGISIMGAVSLIQLPVELMPNTSYPVVTININYPGVPPTEVESMVTTKVEEAVATASHLRNIESSSEDGKSETILEFEPGTDMNFAALEVREKFAKVRNKLPKGIRKPILGKYDVADAPILIFALLSETISTEFMREIADKELKEPLNRVSGVSNVEISGGRERKILVEIDQSRLQSYNLSIEHVVKVLNDNNVNLLAGNFERGDYRYLVRAIGQFMTVEGIKGIGLAASPDGMVVRVGDVARVRDSFLEAAGYARYDTAPTVSIYVHKERQANTIEVCEGIVKMMKELEPKLRKGMRVVTVLDQSISIKTAIATVKDSLVNGAILAALILVITLKSLRSPLIIAVSIPLAIIATFIVMFFMKITLNTMTLSGLALASGSLVDASIVVLDNIFKKNQEGMPIREASIVGTEEVGFAIVASTITTVVVFLPIIFVNKEIRMLYEGLAITVIFSLMASLFVAQTLLPVMASRVLKDAKAKDSRWVDNAPTQYSKIFMTMYRKLLTLAIRYRYIFLGLVIVMLGLAVYLNTKLGSEFMGSVEENKVTCNLTLPAGTKLDISNDLVKRVERFLAKVPEVKNLSSLVEQNRSEIHVEFKPAAQRKRSTKEVLDELRPQLAQFRPAYVYFEEKQEVGTKTLVLDLFGYDYVILKQLAISIANRLETLPGMTDVRIRMKEGRPEMRFLVDKVKAAQHDINVKTMAEEVNTQMRGVIATNFHEVGNEVETIVRLEEKFRTTLDDINKLTVTAANGDQIYLTQIGTFSPGLGPSEIWRKNKSRMIQTSASVSTDLGSAVTKVRDALTSIDFPKGYYYRFGGNYDKMMESSKQLSWAVLLTVLLVYMVLAAFFESYYQPIIIMLSVVMAIIGVVLALYITGKPKSVGVFIGMLMLAGMVVNPAIILVDTINLLLQQGLTRYRAILQASQSRLRPIFMTVSTAVLGLLPMAVDQSEGSNLWSPLAITVVGGLITSTILTLIFVPCVYLIFNDIIDFFKSVIHWIKRKLFGQVPVQSVS